MLAKGLLTQVIVQAHLTYSAALLPSQFVTLTAAKLLYLEQNRHTIFIRVLDILLEAQVNGRLILMAIVGVERDILIPLTNV